MPTTYLTSNEYSGCSPRECCARERERLLLVQKRLELQKERIGLDIEILEAEKLSFKKSVKLAAKRKKRSLDADKGGTEQNRKQFREQQDEIENLRAQVKAFQKKEKRPERGVHLDTRITGTESSSEKQMAKILKFKEELREVKREHKTVKKKHKLEKEQWEKEKLEPDETDSGIDSSLKDEVMRISQLLETSKSENNALKEEKFRLKQSFESFSKIVSLGEIENQLAGTDILDEVAKKFEVLLKERDMLEVQVRDQSRQIDDWKLLLPRNKTLLEKTISKNKQLMKQLEDSQRRNQPKLQQQMTTDDTEHKHDRRDENTIKDMDTVCLEHGSTKVLSTTNSSSPPADENKFLIPSDFSSDELKNHDKKFVIEWVWANGENGLGGLFTGWLDLGGNPSGKGTLRIDDGGIYIGEWKAGRRNGDGVYTSVDGAIYSGPWLNDKFQGRGVFVSETNQVYTGDWKNGLRHGSGIETWSNGACYTGYYQFDERNGAF